MNIILNCWSPVCNFLSHIIVKMQCDLQQLLRYIVCIVCCQQQTSQCCTSVCLRWTRFLTDYHASKVIADAKSCLKLFFGFINIYRNCTGRDFNGLLVAAL